MEHCLSWDQWGSRRFKESNRAPVPFSYMPSPSQRFNNAPHGRQTPGENQLHPCLSPGSLTRPPIFRARERPSWPGLSPRDLFLFGTAGLLALAAGLLLFAAVRDIGSFAATTPEHGEKRCYSDRVEKSFHNALSFCVHCQQILH